MSKITEHRGPFTSTEVCTKCNWYRPLEKVKVGIPTSDYPVCPECGSVLVARAGYFTWTETTFWYFAYLFGTIKYTGFVQK